MKKPILTAIALALFAFSARQLPAQLIEWETEIEQAAQLAADQNKLVLLHFTADWCHPCKSLEKFVFTNPRVQRAIKLNCVPVQVDVDQHSNLVKEYGVSGVPFDIAITPSGRVVSKRSSPRDASAYGDMIEGYSNVIHSLTKGNNPALNQQLDELKDAMKVDHQIVKNPTITPKSAAHQAPEPSVDSQELKRKSRIVNPFAQTSAPESPSIAASKSSPDRQEKSRIANPYAQAIVARVQPAKSTVDLVPDPQPLAVIQKNDFVPSAARSESRFIHNDFMPVSPAIEKSQPSLAIQHPQVSDQISGAVIETKSTDPNAPVIKPEASPTALLQKSKLDLTEPENQFAFVPPATADASLVIPNPKSPAKPQLAPQPKSFLDDRFFKEPATDSEEAIAPVDALATNHAKPMDRFEFKSSPADSQSQSNLAHSAAKSSTESFALHGKCPVTLLKEGRWVDGDAKHGCVHRQRTYLFANQQNLREFQRDPDAYSPLLAGYDPVIFKRNGELVDGEEGHGVFMGKAPNQRVVLFSTPETRAEFESNPRAYIETIRQAMNSTGGSSSAILR